MNVHGRTLPAASPNARNDTAAKRESGTEVRTPGSRPIFAAGEVVAGAYRITRLLAEGGMGQVFEAQDLALGRTVAIKASCPAVAAGTLRAEARAIGCVQHPALVTIHALVTHGDIDCLVMERIRGAALETLISARRATRQRYEADEVLDILVGIAAGLGALHRAGLAHRDLKPANVMIAPDGRIVLMDLGLGLAECSLANRPGNAPVAGTPVYMAPESILGTVKPGDLHLTDVYALGIIAFELCTGEPPFDHDELTQLLAAHVKTTPPRLRSLRPDLPEALDDLVAELLQKAAGDRPNCVEEILWRLRAMQRQTRADAGPRSVDDAPRSMRRGESRPPCSEPARHTSPGLYRSEPAPRSKRPPR